MNHVTALGFFIQPYLILCVHVLVTDSLSLLLYFTPFAQLLHHLVFFLIIFYIWPVRFNAQHCDLSVIS